MSQSKDEASEDKMLCQGRYGMLHLSQRTDFIGGWDNETGCLNKEPMIKKLAAAAENDATECVDGETVFVDLETVFM